MSQIALPLELRGQSDPDRIVIGNANLAVYEALADPKSWPFRTAVLTGPPRSGKSLIGRWASGQGVKVIDGADTVDETELFHRWNAAQESGEPLLLISDRQPWEISLPDLRSRLGGSLQLEILTPDDKMVAQLIEIVAEQRGLSLSDGATQYLVPRIERSFAGIENLVAAIDRLSLERKAPATMSIWRDALDQVQGPEQQRLL
ncbi:DnaA/Hda family protein [Altererythrobacter arenosus]|uniref:DnaA/Hda family protein n=1 Tax=Altererythrobacter arenosus TaxID=3032592 RepID=A0ABY8FN96_9SPHN|nr:DnaA/Hda family protein [Altererythrobacter sp. CAU 1644]WFL76500.1 DnaA/Hda family protein [Altererythrobacter sp. CAU 1644]